MSSTCSITLSYLQLADEPSWLTRELLEPAYLLVLRLQSHMMAPYFEVGTRNLNLDSHACTERAPLHHHLCIPYILFNNAI